MTFKTILLAAFICLNVHFVLECAAKAEGSAQETTTKPATPKSLSLAELRAELNKVMASLRVLVLPQEEGGAGEELFLRKLKSLHARRDKLLNLIAEAETK